MSNILYWASSFTKFQVIINGVVATPRVCICTLTEPWSGPLKWTPLGTDGGSDQQLKYSLELLSMQMVLPFVKKKEWRKSIRRYSVGMNKWSEIKLFLWNFSTYSTTDIYDSCHGLITMATVCQLLFISWGIYSQITIFWSVILIITVVIWW